MRKGLQNEVRITVLLTLILLLTGFLNDAVVPVLLFGLAGHLLWLYVRALQFYRWFERDTQTPPPEFFGIYADVSDHLYRLEQRNKQAKKLHRKLLRRIGSITGALDEGMVILTRDRSIDWWNPAATRLLKFNQDDRGRQITNLIRDPGFVNFIQQQEFTLSLEIASHRQAGHTLMFSAATFEGGNIVLTVRDITRLRNLEQMRKDFVANISHELRTPLTVLTGYLETLETGADTMPGTWRTPLAQMSKQAARLTDLADDLVMLSQLESDDIQTEMASIPVRPMLDQIARDAEALSEGKHTLAVECPDSLHLRGDANALYSALANLAFNAVRHNPQGADILLKAEQAEANLAITVRDSGIGIDIKHIPRLTERFYRVDSSRTSSTGGTGLGLAIVKHVLLRHGAELKITSQLGRGTAMTCLFPSQVISAAENA